MLKKCIQCFLPENYPRITFNEQGVCNYCLTHKETKYLGQAKLLNFVAPYRNNNRGKYDCVVAMSGGRDSTFAAYYVVTTLNLRVLAYTYDNGFMPEQTRENIKNAVGILDIDHVVEKDEIMKKSEKRILSSWIHKPSPAMIAFLCTGCNTGFIRGLDKTVQKNNIDLVITGDGEPEDSFALKLLSISDCDDNDRKGKARLALILGFLREVVRNPYYLNPNCSVFFAKEFYYRFLHKAKDYKYTPLFKFIEWNEEMILSVIRREMGWKNPPHSRTTWRSDCKVHSLRQYLYKETLGFNKTDEMMSGMLRENMITRENAQQRLEGNDLVTYQFLITFLDELGLSFADMDMALREYGKTTR